MEKPPIQKPTGLVVDNHGTWSRLPTKIRIARSNLIPRLCEISFLVSDGAFAEPFGTFVDNQRSQGIYSNHWTRARADSRVKKLWLKTLGQGLASHFSIARGRDKFSLSDFPKGYQLFYHVKNKNSSQTPYLFGYPTKSKLILKFRTATDFLPHLIWLASQDEKDRCKCKHCQSRGFVAPQPELEVKTLSAGSQTIQTARQNHGSQDDVPEINPNPPDLSLQEPVGNYRPLELVWCELDTKNLKIRLDCKYWPGICQKKQVKLEACEVVELSAQENQSDPKMMEQSHRDNLSTTWKVRNEVQKKHYWSVQLVGISDLVMRAESQLLPWLYRPFEESVWSVVSTGKLPVPNYLLDSNKPMPTLASLSNPVIGRLHFQLAIQIGAEIEGTWAPAEDSEDLDTTLEISSDKQSLPSNNFSMSHRMQCNSVWLGAERICSQDLVRLKLLENPHHTSLDIVSLDITSDQILFLHIHFFWKSPHSKSVIAGGRIFELVPHKSSEELAKNSGSRQSKNSWLRQCADLVPKGATLTSSDQLPPAPKGFHFSQITPDHSLHHLEISCIAGRYYSPKADHDRLGRLRNYFSTKNGLSSPTLKRDVKERASLLGIRSGQENFMRFSKARATRGEMLLEASRKSRKNMSSHFRRVKPATKNKMVKNRV
ncbi:hypothetical protein PTTG_12255 [Puccinia triticina 1-1 BBBD Race 1]|uniref:Cryptic loci regulator 2 N-terminal domain-containing protein n=2 Tax=Puccinia triticina TaxID=208348 RepID=A0A180H4T7_PUCT1|nr:uncharacterized protein PtA15_2A645 [Puccinia triticina]OAV99831.1 hypothetical protein PTTG_12255 [Puccinia triticina 1-1 BBBD Race 1]WAQ82328.1 hypothetical protein PtA15_2A645 [Puccinia triticina]WAR53177.1 hypothetical protein PtB15_2B608 [Puccinia triticina]